jgi:hypothetical protein
MQDYALKMKIFNACICSGQCGILKKSPLGDERKTGKAAP